MARTQPPKQAPLAAATFGSAREKSLKIRQKLISNARQNAGIHQQEHADNRNSGRDQGA